MEIRCGKMSRMTIDFSFPPEVDEIRFKVRSFIDEVVRPIEERGDRESWDRGQWRDGIIGMRKAAQEWGLWLPHMPKEWGGMGLGHVAMAAVSAEAARSRMGPFAVNAQAPDEGNMHTLLHWGTDEQKQEYLKPLCQGRARSCFAMTEPEVAGSDPTLLRTRAVRDGDSWVLNGHKWFTSGAVGASIAIVMVVTDPDAPRHRRASMILVPIDTPGFNLIRPVPVMGHAGGGGHCEIRYEDCRVPAANLLGPESGGFEIAQARLGPGRIHHCMRAIGGAERALEMMCRRANSRVAFGGPLAEKQFVQEMIAASRMEIDQARLLVLHAAWKMDTVGKKEARQEISMIKVVAANLFMRVLDRAIQVHGALGVSDDTPLARMWRDGRMLRLADGPDEVHKQVIARRELARYA